MNGLCQEEGKDYGRNNLPNNTYDFTYYRILLCDNTYRIEILSTNTLLAQRLIDLEKY